MCGYANTVKNGGVQPKLRPNFGGGVAVEITPGFISRAIPWCLAFKMATTPEGIDSVQKVMCEGYEPGGTYYLTDEELALIDNSKL